jgi:hypothetical protein
MNAALVDKIARAVLYEGYNLYPYRPSLKSRHRWTFGGVYPHSYSDAHSGSDAWSMQTQCLVEGGPGARLDVKVHFLHLVERNIGRLVEPLDDWPREGDPHYEIVESLEVGPTRYASWQEAVERDVAAQPADLHELTARSRCERFSFPARHELEPLREPGGRIAGVMVRDQEAIEGVVELAAEEVAAGLFRVTARIVNATPLENAGRAGRDDALLRTLVSAHTILAIAGGQFVSLIDPPEHWRTATAACRNVGAWPVLLGQPPEREAMLSAPIILYDYPQLAPESPGDLFDATEIDEILTLRIMTLTDQEKQLAQSVDERTRTLLQRTESLARQQLAGLHGAVRSLTPLPSPLCGAGISPGICQASETPAPQESAGEPAGMDPFDKRPTLASVRIRGVEVRPGDRVWLRPRAGGDILDLALKDKTATIESIEQDMEDRIYLAVVVEDDPGSDFGRQRQPGHRFFFQPEEVLPLGGGGNPR